MKFNTKIRYGLRTMLELALNANSKGGVFQKNIAKNQDVSVKYLDHIIASLKAAGLIKNVGGKKSGYKLNRPPEKISIYDVYVAFENKLAITDCLLTDGECHRKQQCVLRDYWCDLNQSMQSSLESMSMKTLAEKHRTLNHTAEFSNNKL
jgi:Rrf2 family protein